MATRILHGTIIVRNLKEDHLRTFLYSLAKIQSIVSEEKFFEGRVYCCTQERTDGQTHDGYNAMTLARWPSTSGAIKYSLKWYYTIKVEDA